MTNDELMTKHECLKRGPIRPSSLVIPSPSSFGFFHFPLRLLAFATVAALEGRVPASPTRATGVAELCPPIPPNRKRVWCLTLHERAIFHHPTKTNLHASLRASSLIRHSSFVIRASSFFYAPRIRETCGKDSTRAAISGGSPFLICSTEIALATSNRPDFTRRNA
jgi:hypothetical protein